MRMKRITLLTMLVALFSVTAFAQKGMKMIPFSRALSAPSATFQGIDRKAQPAANLSRRAAGELVTPPDDATYALWYTVGGTFYVASSSGLRDATKDMPYVRVAIYGNDIYLQGLAYWFSEGWIKGTINGTTVTFANGQFIGEDEYGPEYLCGSDDGETLCDIVFNYDAEEGLLTAVTPYIYENSSNTELSAYCYWDKPVFSQKEPAKPELVVLPEGIVAEPYCMTYQSEDGTASVPMYVAVDGNDVYLQGISKFLPEAWVKGTKSENTVTFPAKQYVGEYEDYGSSYAFYNGDAVFTYDAETGTYAAVGEVYGVLADRYYDGLYTNPVLKKVIEKAGTPATPTITEVEESQFGPLMTFMVPVIDTEGNGLVTSKLSYQVFSDIDQEVSPVTFKVADYSKLEQDMTVIPYGFTENYDFYDTQIYLNMPEYKNFNKIGIQSIYTGGGEEHKSEIFWYTIKEYGYVEPTPVEVPENLVTDTYIFSAMQLEEGEDEAVPYSFQSQVGFDGDDVYIKGLSINTADMWLKATKNEAGQYVIPARQYMGQLNFYGLFVFDYYLAARDAEDNALDVVLDFDAEKSIFTTNQTVVLNGVQIGWEPYQTFTEVSLTKLADVAATPVDPIAEGLHFDNTYPVAGFSIPAQGTQGEILDNQKFFYTVWIEKDGKEQPYTFTAAAYDQDFDVDVTEIPYLHDGYDVYSGGERVYFEEPFEELSTWTKVGIQSIYYGGGEVRKSNIVWLANETFLPTELAIGQDSYSTFYDAYHNVVVPEGVKAYVVTAATTENLTYSELPGVIPAGTAVVLEGQAGTYPVEVSAEEASYDGINLLQGSNVATTTTAEVEGCLFYKLAYGHSGTPNANKLGWYWGAENGGAFEIEAHRAWLAIPQIVASAPGYPFGGGVTGIADVRTKTDARGDFYDLQGRRVITPAKGLYIQNNKKVIIK